MIYFYRYLEATRLSHGTINLYMRAVEDYLKFSNKVISKAMLVKYKSYLLEHFKAKTINTYILAINKYLEYLKKDSLKLTYVKLQQKPFLNNVISNREYNKLKSNLKEDGKMNWYFVVKFLANTGARISELVQIRVEHISIGFIDIYGKGGKMRRIYIPKSLRQEALEWLSAENVTNGYFFTNKKQGERISPRGIACQLKKIAFEYGINPEVVYPHSFRHRFAKNFLEKYPNMALLADLMGHDSIETTRIYLRKTAAEQRMLIDKIIDW